jgi:hypothetical protein
MLQIVNVKPSPLKTKRFRVTLNDDTFFDFGQHNGATFIDHGDETKRKNYWARHFANMTERARITTLSPSAALFSAFLLWGPYTRLQDNIHHLNSLFSKP